MTDEERLVVLKKDLQMLTSGNDDYLKTLLEYAKNAVEREGVDTEGGIEGDMVVIQYAAYLFRKRASGDTAMPRFPPLAAEQHENWTGKEGGTAVTFDDGILTVYQTENIAEPGMKPVIGLKEKGKILLRVRGTGIQPGLYRHAGQTADRGQL